MNLLLSLGLEGPQLNSASRFLSHAAGKEGATGTLVHQGARKMSRALENFMICKVKSRRLSFV